MVLGGKSTTSVDDVHGVGLMHSTMQTRYSTVGHRTSIGSGFAWSAAVDGRLEMAVVGAQGAINDATRCWGGTTGRRRSARTFEMSEALLATAPLVATGDGDEGDERGGQRHPADEGD